MKSHASWFQVLAAWHLIWRFLTRITARSAAWVFTVVSLWSKVSRRIRRAVGDAGWSIPDSGARPDATDLTSKLKLRPWASQGYRLAIEMRSSGVEKVTKCGSE